MAAAVEPLGKVCLLANRREPQGNRSSMRQSKHSATLGASFVISFILDFAWCQCVDDFQVCVRLQFLSRSLHG